VVLLCNSCNNFALQFDQLNFTKESDHANADTRQWHVDNSLILQIKVCRVFIPVKNLKFSKTPSYKTLTDKLHTYWVHNKFQIPQAIV